MLKDNLHATGNKNHKKIKYKDDTQLEHRGTFQAPQPIGEEL
jgi:hypothetical protein